ncbi:UNVERIFIED_CONTAM: hypothetical protein GTU68_025815 [Idotea baltica]|nr:hypothetical protein [Idotea baltica]
MNFGKGRDSGREGLEWLLKIKELSAETPVITMTAYSDVNIAVEALKSGAHDFIEKPWRNEKILITIQNIFTNMESERRVSELENTQEALQQTIEQPFSEIIGDNKVAATDAHVLILGENGTGKELIARALHKKSSRSDRVFIPVDLGAIPESLFESELFGHKKGAFTGAHQDRVGRFAAAAHGTLFLDEIGNLSMSSQSKLLHALQSHQVIPIGSNKPLKVDIRLVCATNMPLYQMVDEGRFRQDLLYRINTVEVHLPSLRQRRSDIEALTNHYLDVYKRKYRKEDLAIDAEALKKLESYGWPGNVRELKHIVERTVIMSEGSIVRPQDIILTSSQASAVGTSNEMVTIEEMEERMIREVMNRNNGNISKSAMELGLTRTSLYRRLEKFGI